MNKKTFYAIAIAVVFSMSYSVLQEYNKTKFTGMLLANIEALTADETFTFDGDDWDDDHHWYNHAGSKWKPEKRECTYNSGSFTVGVSVGIGNTSLSSSYTTSSYSQPGHKIDCVEGDGNCINGTDCIPD